MEKGNRNPKYAPGMDDTDIIPQADEEDKERGNVTAETRVLLDEVDPSGKDFRYPD
jgi:hypothetical protein